LEFPEPSVTIHITLVIPTGYTKGALLTNPETEQLSLTTGAMSEIPITLHEPGVVLTVTGPEHVIVGLVLSVTTTLNEHVAVFPAASVAVQVTIVVPKLKEIPFSEVPVPVVAPDSV
jgi:hypothetical protein